MGGAQEGRRRAQEAFDRGEYRWVAMLLDHLVFADPDDARLHHRRREPDPGAAATVRLTRELLVRLVTGQAGLRELVFSDELSVDGSRLELLGFLSLLGRPGGEPFPIVTP